MEPRRYRIKMWRDETQRWEFYVSHRSYVFATTGEIKTHPAVGREWENIAPAHARMQTLRFYGLKAELDPIW
jgi:hypothetical protein